MRNIVIAVAAATAAMSFPFVHAQAPRSIWSGVYTAEQSRRGEVLYEKWCSQCHRADLTGLRVEPQFAGAPDRTPELVGSTFVASWNGTSVADLVERIRLSMPQNQPGVLKRSESADIVAYLLFQGGFPFGAAELSDRLDDLRQIRILAHKE